jgi:hypothetical protein
MLKINPEENKRSVFSAKYCTLPFCRLATFAHPLVGRSFIFLPVREPITNPKASHAVFPVTARALSTHFIHELHYMWND